MGKTRVWSILVIIMAAAISALAQRSNHVIEARTVLAADGVPAGSSIRAAALARVALGYHVNDHNPSKEYLIPTEWTITGTKVITVEKMAYPKGELKKFTFSDDRLSVYEGDLTIGALLKVSRGARPGDYKLKGALRYQACNQEACLPPKSLPLDLDVKVLPQGTASKRVNAEVFRDVRFD